MCKRLAIAVPVQTLPVLCSIMGLLLIWAGAVRLRGLTTAPHGQRVSGLLWGLFGLAAGAAIVGYAVHLYLF